MSLIVVTGPTASGKTSKSIAIAKAIDGEIINADSVQVYKDFNIGSAKPSESELGGIPHHLLSIVSANDSFDSQQFCKLAAEKIAEIKSRGKVPIVCGGTGLYLRSLLCGMLDLESIEQEYRESLEKEAEAIKAKGQDVSKELHQMLELEDVYSARQIHPNDIQRVKRALLVFRSTGKSFVKMQEEHSFGKPQYRALVMVLAPERAELHKKINARVLQMIDCGLLDEVKELLARYPLNTRPFGAIGYRHVAEYLRGDYSFDKMVETLKRDTRRFAKRQRTWWRNQPRYLGWKNVTQDFSSLDSKFNSEFNSGLDSSDENQISFFKDFLNSNACFSEQNYSNKSSSDLAESSEFDESKLAETQKRIYFFEYDRL